MADWYDHRRVESDWQQVWKDKKVFEVEDPASVENPCYILDMFPYPSGTGLHVGHLLGYTGSDILARYQRKNGKTVLHPMGWDAFGLPAENFAIKSGVHPAVSTSQNTIEYKRQLSQAGLSYDWSKEINTSDPEYYRWTQWFFSLLYKKGLAYRKEGMVNWCPKCQTVLANEQVVNGRCERCDTPVVQKLLKQWYFKITDYAERLLSDLDGLDWPEKIKTMQRNWIGKSEGVQLTFAIEGSTDSVQVFTTRPDTLFGVTYLVLAPEHPLVAKLTTEAQKIAVQRYLTEVSETTELERTFTDRPKTGVDTGAYAIHPITGKKLQIWVADYVLGSYGTGAVMAVPAHDQRDWEFATKYGLPSIQVIQPPAGTETQENKAYTGLGSLINSGELDGISTADAPKRIVELIADPAKAAFITTYRLRDWLVSRQRFWGSPIPIAYDEQETEYLIPDNELPVVLPMDVEFLPTGQSPLTLANDWKTYRAPDGRVLRREVDTLDTFVCSSWYFLRFLTPHLQDKAFDKDIVEKWLPVDTYIGGAEHAVLHLLYARFFTKVLFDEGLVSFSEPFTSLRNQGSILGPDHAKMSKSKGNVINPDTVVNEYGADSLRVYEMFMAPFELEKPWNTQGLVGVRRFLERVWRLSENLKDSEPSKTELTAIHRAIQKVGDDIVKFRFNTAVSTLMETVNVFYEELPISRQSFLTLLSILNPLAPHMTEELWKQFGGEGYCSMAPWPSFDPAYIQETEVEYPVQINGKVRFKVSAATGASEEEILALVQAHPRYAEYVTGEVKKHIVVPGRLVSLVIG